MDNNELRRSTLERKDRDELVTIATALGQKPPSRARKAEIVDLIIATATSSATDDDGSAEGEAPVEEAAGDSSSDNADAKDGNDDAQPMTYHAGDDEEFDFGQVSTKPSKGRNRNRKDRNRDRGEKNGNRKDTKDRSDDEIDADAQGSGDPVEDDRGSRRQRRRRGRDRDNDTFEGEPVPVEGVLDLRDDGYGFLRVDGVLPSKADAYVSVKQVRQFGLRRGDVLTGTSRPAVRNEKNPAMLSIDTVNGETPDEAKDRPVFESLTPVFPNEKLLLERRADEGNMTARIIDLLAPIGKGQRGMIVAPPKAGKTTIMKSIAASIEENDPDVELIVLLVDERPEEVTDMARSLKKGTVAASTFDRPADEHIAVAEMTVERAKRMVEIGRDVVIILDGITRLARAYNQAAPANGRIMSGGLDASAIYPPKRLFGAARNVEGGGSLTILATALVDTGSKMDEVIFEEFKGTGNMELRLDRRAAERRIYPAIDVDASSTRHEELLFERHQLNQVWALRKVLSGMAAESDNGPAAGLELLIDRLKTFKTNAEFLKEVGKQV